MSRRVNAAIAISILSLVVSAFAAWQVHTGSSQRYAVVRVAHSTRSGNWSRDEYALLDQASGEIVCLTGEQGLSILPTRTISSPLRPNK
jgi:hypothetical protein